MYVRFRMMSNRQGLRQSEISTTYDRDDLGKGLDAFAKVGKKLGVVQ